ncbi:MAG: hypothetical protein GY810_23055 [Aureispira sp.]|nr:hypothetical protein [Aureispira sp.]
MNALKILLVLVFATNLSAQTPARYLTKDNQIKIELPFAKNNLLFSNCELTIFVVDFGIDFDDELIRISAPNLPSNDGVVTLSSLTFGKKQSTRISAEYNVDLADFKIIIKGKDSSQWPAKKEEVYAEVTNFIATKYASYNDFSTLKKEINAMAISGIGKLSDKGIEVDLIPVNRKTRAVACSSLRFETNRKKQELNLKIETRVILKEKLYRYEGNQMATEETKDVGNGLVTIGRMYSCIIGAEVKMVE